MTLMLYEKVVRDAKKTGFNCKFFDFVGWLKLLFGTMFSGLPSDRNPWIVEPAFINISVIKPFLRSINFVGYGGKFSV